MVDKIRDEVIALDDLIEIYSNEMQDNSFKIASMHKEIDALENKNRVLGDKIASTLRQMEGIIGG